MKMRQAIPALTALLLGALARDAGAREISFKKWVDPARLQQELNSQGFGVHWITCVKDGCRMSLSSQNDPSGAIAAHAYTDPFAKSEQRRTALRALLGKWKAGTITSDEKDTLIKGMAEMLLE